MSVGALLQLNSVRVLLAAVIGAFIVWVAVEYEGGPTPGPSTKEAARPSRPPAPRTGPVITKATPVAEVPKPPKATAHDLNWAGIDGLNVEVLQAEPAVVPGHAVLKLTALPTTGPHHLIGQFSGFPASRACRVTIWAKAQSAERVVVGLNNAATKDYGAVFFDLKDGTVTREDGKPLAKSIASAPNGWRKVAVELSCLQATDVSFGVGVVNDENSSSFAGDGQTQLLFGGAELEVQN